MIDSDDDVLVFAWAIFMFMFGYVFGLLQQYVAYIEGHESLNGRGVCLGIDECPTYIMRNSCTSWNDF